MKKFKFNKREMNILKKALEDLLEIGLTEVQEEYIHNIDQGMSVDKADQIYFQENKKYWERMVYEKKNTLYCLYHKLFPIL